MLYIVEPEESENDTQERLSLRELLRYYPDEWEEIVRERLEEVAAEV